MWAFEGSSTSLFRALLTRHSNHVRDADARSCVGRSDGRQGTRLLAGHGPRITWLSGDATHACRPASRPLRVGPTSTRSCRVPRPARRPPHQEPTSDATVPRGGRPSTNRPPPRPTQNSAAEVPGKSTDVDAAVGRYRTSGPSHRHHYCCGQHERERNFEDTQDIALDRALVGSRLASHRVNGISIAFPHCVPPVIRRTQSELF